MKKATCIIVSLMMIFVMFVNTSSAQRKSNKTDPTKTEESDGSISDEKWDAYEKEARDKYKSATDDMNKRMSPATQKIIDRAIMVQRFEGNIPIMVFLSNYMYLMFNDLASCYTKPDVHQSLVQEAYKYGGLRGETMQMYPERSKANMIEILKEATDYYNKTKTRLVKYPKCKKMVGR